MSCVAKLKLGGEKGVPRVKKTAKNLEEVKELNLSLVIKLIQKMKVCSRSQLAEMSGLQQSSITNIINRLIEYGLVKETGSFVGKKGRRSIGVTLNNDSYRVIGVRLTRKDYSVGRFDVNGQIERRISRNVAPETSAEKVLDGIEEDIRSIMDESPYKIAAIGMAVPGPYLAKESRILLITGARKWENIDFEKQFASRFEVPFYIEHDANAGVMAEWLYGAHPLEQQTYLYVAAGTGIGAGLIIDDQVFHGAMGIAGEIGHMTINCMGRECSCGNKGCLEVYASSAAVCRDISDMMIKGRGTLLAENFDFEAATAAFKDNDSVAEEAFFRSADYLGIGVASIIYAYNPGIIIIGDDMAKGGALYLQRVKDSIRKWVLPEIYEGTRIYLSSFKDDPALIGAAALAIDKCFQQPSLLLEILLEERESACAEETTE